MKKEKFSVEVDIKILREWKNTIPRTEKIKDRFLNLIKEDIKKWTK